MSYIINVYSPTHVILGKRDIETAVADKGWEIAFLAEDAFNTAQDDPVMGTIGPLDDATLVVGWRSDASEALTLREIVNRRDMKALDHLAKSSGQAACTLLRVSNPYQLDIEAVEAIVASHPHSDLAAAMRTAKVEYLLELLGRSQLAFDLIRSLWLTIAELCCGFAEDGQFGEYVSFAK
jgi:hypothetical protein